MKLGTVLCVSLIVGVMQIIMSYCKLGVLSVYFSPPFISGVNVGAAAQIFTTQVNIEYHPSFYSSVSTEQ